MTADLLADAPPGAFGPRATALIARLRGRFRLSIDDTAKCLAELWNLPLCAASVVTSCERVSAAIAPLDAAIAEAVQTAPSLNVDETSWPTETRRGWLWVAVSRRATCFRIHPSRSGPALRALLGETYYGIVGSDRYLVYDQIADRYRRLCWAHLIRNLRGLLECYAEERRWAQGLLDLSDELFLAWQLYKGGWMDRVSLQQALLPLRQAMRHMLQEGAGSAGGARSGGWCYEQSYELFRAVGNRWGELTSLHRLAQLTARRGQLAAAAHLYHETLHAPERSAQSRIRLPPRRSSPTSRASVSHGDACTQPAAGPHGGGGLRPPADKLPRMPALPPGTAEIGLTARELKALRLVVTGRTDAQVAEYLALSTRTVSSYLSSIYNKLQVRSRSAATHWVLKHGIA